MITENIRLSGDASGPSKIERRDLYDMPDLIFAYTFRMSTLDRLSSLARREPKDLYPKNVQTP